MTELAGRRARWTSALVLAPGTAAVFAATMSWAAATRPTTAAPPSASTTTTSPGAPAAAVPPAPALARELHRVVRIERRRKHELADQLTSVREHLIRMRAAERRQLKALAVANRQPAPAPVALPPLPSGQLPPVAAAPPPPPPVQAPPPPPPVQGTTGSSGSGH